MGERRQRGKSKNMTRKNVVSWAWAMEGLWEGGGGTTGVSNGEKDRITITEQQ